MIERDNFSKQHYPVMHREVIDILKPQEGHMFIDATFGCAGHTTLLLNKLAKVISLDRDLEAIERAKEVAKQYPDHFQFVHTKFSNINKIELKQYCNGIVWDFGLCSTQLNSNRGFSFYQEHELDMGMGLNETNAKTILNAYSYEELSNLFFNLADEKKARIYAKRIVELRKNNPIVKMSQLLSIFNYEQYTRIHPATKVLQALRMEVNNELEEIEMSLNNAWEIAHNGTIFVCISFHSGEDRIIKHLFAQWKKIGKISEYSKSPLTPKDDECKINPASRSAKLRWCVLNK